jgi:hypothetical protein
MRGEPDLGGIIGIAAGRSGERLTASGPEVWDFFEAARIFCQDRVAFSMAATAMSRSLKDTTFPFAASSPSICATS